MATEVDDGAHSPAISQQDRWIHLTEWPLAIAGVVFVLCYAVEVLAQPGGTAEDLLEAVIFITWAGFVIDYLVRLGLAGERLRWFVRHLPELLIVALPVLRPLRLLRLLAVLAVLHRVAGQAIRGRVLAYTVVACLMLIFVASLAILDTERGSDDATIRNFEDALWWSITTVTTIGYGDYAPTTLTGRMIAVGLMIGGISLIGVVTASIATWIVERVNETDEANLAATKRQIDALHDEVRDLRADIARLTPQAHPGSTTNGAVVGSGDAEHRP
ncbi:voltage-gated potassium channel [Williamsia muralis]|uniref:Voltage-gated potassium channel n=1 Tax=Williamsia marianensis TaxID=85044 RepID=A0A495K2D0_WILMA|nr:voltage-gated potassium channel [Williamsia muralis]